jgi:hypothetical protein
LATIGAVRIAQIIADHVAQYASHFRQSLALEQLKRSKVEEASFDASALGAVMAVPDPPGSIPFVHNLLGDVPKALFNTAELEFARSIERLGLPWFRNQVGQGWYSLPGLGSSCFYPDFVLPLEATAAGSFKRVVVFETKGRHLIGSDDSERKREACDAVSLSSGGRIEAHFGDFAYCQEVLHRIAGELRRT